MVKIVFLNFFIFFFQTTNFANPMYARLYTTDSTQVLLPKESDGDDDMLDKNGDLNFYGSKGNPKKSSSNNY
jgi:hypothetical protein